MWRQVLALALPAAATMRLTGAAGLPSIDSAGNVLRPKTSLKLSMRLPPTVDGEQATRAMKKALETDTPYNARVSFTVVPTCNAVSPNCIDAPTTELVS